MACGGFSPTKIISDPSGVVECGGFNLLLANASKDNLTDDLFATADIIYVNYMANSSFGSQDAAKVHNWLKASHNRVLIVSYDAYDVSVPLMTEILGTTDNLIWLRKTGDPFTLTGKSSGNYFTDARTVHSKIRSHSFGFHA